MEDVQTAPAAVVERVEMARMAGELVTVASYLEVLVAVRNFEQDGDAPGLRRMSTSVRATRARLIELSESLPSGPLETFGREHPLYFDDLDNVATCGYGGKPFQCPIKDPALHWDAWELLGTRHKRPESAKR